MRFNSFSCGHSGLNYLLIGFLLIISQVGFKQNMSQLINDILMEGESKCEAKVLKMHCLYGDLAPTSL